MVIHFVRYLKKCKGGSYIKFSKNYLERKNSVNTLTQEEAEFLINIIKVRMQGHKSSRCSGRRGQMEKGF